MRKLKSLAGSTPLGLGFFRDVQAVGRRSVEYGGFDFLHPFDGAFGLAGDARAKGKGHRAQPFGPEQRPPTAPVEAEKGADKNDVVRAARRTPTCTRVRFGDAFHVGRGDAEGRGPPGGARRALHASQNFPRARKVAAEGRGLGLVLPDFVLVQKGYGFEIVQRSDVFGLDARPRPISFCRAGSAYRRT